MSARRPSIAMLSVILAGLPGLAALAWPGSADAEPYLRVIAQRAPVHSGPNGSYRQVFIAERGQVFAVLERGTRDFWFKVELDDGTSGWILGDMVFPFEVGPPTDLGVFTRMGRAIKGAILGPSPVTQAMSGCRSRPACSTRRACTCSARRG